MERDYSLKASSHDTGAAKKEKEPQGFYTFQITDYKEKDKEGNFFETKKGDPKVGVICKIVDNKEEGKSIYHNIIFYRPDSPSLNGIGITRHFLKCIGEPWEGDLTADLDSWIGKRFKAEVIHDGQWANLAEIQGCDHIKESGKVEDKNGTNVEDIAWEE